MSTDQKTDIDPIIIPDGAIDEIVTNPDGSRSRVEITGVTLAETEEPDDLLDDVTDPDPEVVRSVELDIEELVDDLDLGEIKLIEKTTGMKVGAFMKALSAEEYGVDVLIALAWIALRRVDPDATIEDAERVKLSAIAGDEDEDEDEEGDENP